MGKEQMIEILNKVKSGGISPEEALLHLRAEPFEDLGYAKPDFHREIRQGAAEVIYGAGKTAGQIIGICSSMRSKGVKTILVTRLDKGSADEIAKELPLEYHDISRTAIVGELPETDGKGSIVIATGGTSDIPVAEEAAMTCKALGNDIVCLYDVGVSGLHRLLSQMPNIQSARVIVAVAGMEGALASVIGGLSDCPVIAVPTSVGYGAAFGGVAALLSMLNSCASGVSVVNIDNGFGAGYLASMINHI